MDARLLREDWLSRLGPEGTAVLALLALAADHQGASFYRRDTMALRLGLERAALDRALARLVQLGLVAHRPWRPGHPDGVWQLLPLPRLAPAPPRGGTPSSICDLVRQLRRESAP